MTSRGRLTKKTSDALDKFNLNPNLSDKTKDRLGNSGQIPTTKNRNKFVIKFEDGSKLSFDRSTINNADSAINRKLDSMNIPKVSGRPITTQLNDLKTVLGRKSSNYHNRKFLERSGLRLSEPRNNNREIDVFKDNVLVGTIKRTYVNRSKELKFIKPDGTEKMFFELSYILE